MGASTFSGSFIWMIWRCLQCIICNESTPQPHRIYLLRRNQPAPAPTRASWSMILATVGIRWVPGGPKKTAGPFSKTKVWYGLMTSRGSQTLQWSEDVRGCWRSVCWSVGPSFSQTSRPWARWGSRGTRKTALNCLHDRFEEAIWECLLDLRVGCWVREDHLFLISTWISTTPGHIVTECWLLFQ